MFASLRRCRPPGCGRARREGSIEELDIERDDGAPKYPSAKDRPSMTCGLGPVCRFSAPSFGEELLNPGDTVPYQATNSASLQPKIAHPTFEAESETPYIDLEGEESLESPGHESEKLVQDLAHVKQSLGHLNKLVTLLTIVALLSTTGLLTLLYGNLSLPNQILARRYALLATIPMVALLFTWFNIWLAIQMMFLPVEFFGLWQYQSSGMGIGWQGLVPRKCEKMARMSYKCARPFLEGPGDWLSRVDPKRLVSEVRSELRVVIDNAMAHVLKKYLPRTDNRMPSAIRTSMTEQALDNIQETAPELWKNFTNLLCNDEFGIDNDGMIVKVFTENKELLNQFFLILGDREFRFIEHCGAAMGFVCGLLQLLAFNHLSSSGRAVFLPVTGFLLGIVTNWLAILMVFKPCFPKPIKIFGWHICDIQGLFLKRQPEVCVLYSKMLKDNFLSFSKIISYLQTLPGLWERLKVAYMEHSAKVLRQTLGSRTTWLAEWTIGQQGYRDFEEDLKVALVEGKACSCNVSCMTCFDSPGKHQQDSRFQHHLFQVKLLFMSFKIRPTESYAQCTSFDHQPAVQGLYKAHRLHALSSKYISKVTDIEARNRECLQRMPPDEFENLLHPVFQEDEWILILLGGVLGAIVGLAQVYFLSE